MIKEGEGDIPALMVAIAKAVDTGAPLDKVSKVYGYKPEVIQKVAAFAKEAQGVDDIEALLQQKNDPVLSKLYSTLPKPKKLSLDYVTDGRDKWGDMAMFPVETDGGVPMKDIVMKVAGETGIRPEILFASAMEEGLQQSAKTGTYKFGKGEYPVSGFDVMGLDDFGSMYPELKKKYNTVIDFEPSVKVNEKGRTVHGGNFRNMGTAMKAKALVFRDMRDKVTERLKKDNVVLNDDGVDFLTMQAYNAGPNVLDKYLNLYKQEGTLDGGKFIDKEPAGGYEQNPSYVHARRRLDPARMMREKKVFK